MSMLQCVCSNKYYLHVVLEYSIKIIIWIIGNRSGSKHFYRVYCMQYQLTLTIHATQMCYSLDSSHTQHCHINIRLWKWQHLQCRVPSLHSNNTLHCMHIYNKQYNSCSNYSKASCISSITPLKMLGYIIRNLAFSYSCSVQCRVSVREEGHAVMLTRCWQT